MTKKQRNWSLIIILLCISSLAYFYSHKRPKKIKTASVSVGASENIEKPKMVSEVIVPTIEKARSGEQNIQFDCDNRMLEKIAGACKYKCLADYVREKDPELATYIEKENLNSLANNPSYKKATTKLARFYLAKYFRADDTESEDLLRKLSEADKDNAFPALYHAVSLMNLERPASALKVAKEALKRPHYIHYVPDMKKRLKKLTVHDPRLFASAVMFSQAEIQLTAAEYLDSLWHLGEDIQLELGRRLVQQAVKDQGKYSLLNWSPSDFYFGHTSIQAVSEKEAAQLGPLADEIEKDLEDFSDDPAFNCDQKRYENYRQDVMEQLQSIK